VTGKVRTVDGVPSIYDAKLTIEKLEASGMVSFGERLHASVDVEPIELVDWQPLLAPLAGHAMTGRLLTGRWEVWTNPFDLRGAVRMEGVSLAMADGRPLVVDGGVEASEGRIVTRDLVLTADGERVPVEGEITDLGGDWRYRIRSTLAKADSAKLLAALAGGDDTLQGPLDFQGDLTGSFAGESSFLEALGGTARTSDLELRTQDYSFTMQGRIGLEDLGLDARGELVLGDELATTVARRLGLDQIPLLQGVVIPIPRLRGTVTDPKPEPDFTFLLRALTSNLPGVRATEQLLKGVEGLLRKP
jgi:hypothetical protein